MIIFFIVLGWIYRILERARTLLNVGEKGRSIFYKNSPFELLTIATKRGSKMEPLFIVSSSRELSVDPS